MSVKIGVAKIVTSPFQMRRSMRNYNPKSKRNLQQYAAIPKPAKGEIPERKKREISDTLFNYITAYNELFKGKANPSAFKLQSVSISFPHLVFDEDEAKRALDKWKRKMNESDELRRFIIITERGENGGIHYHAIGEFSDQDFTFWKDVVGSNSPFLIYTRNLNIFKKDGKYRMGWKSEIKKAINYILKGTVNTQGFIDGRLYYISKGIRSFKARNLTGKAAIRWIRKNVIYLTKIGEGEFYEIYAMTRYFEKQIIKSYMHVLDLQFNSS